MQLRYSTNLIPPVDGMQKVSAIAWCSSGKKFAVVTADRVNLFLNFIGVQCDFLKFQRLFIFLMSKGQKKINFQRNLQIKYFIK